MNSDRSIELASERLVSHEVENFVGEVTFLVTPRGVDYEPTLHSLVCELHEHLSKRVLRSLRNSITFPPPPFHHPTSFFSSF